ncbi:c-type cytochrome biogenesis protein CcmI [uncultured Brevundimonas sp.]|uniref:c-type cytochrome biogenesis protein CcmI n=1 Tax=uncultured Brevundimonas sp. TaxID=213418 RepID=UPI00261D1460|nr:c-type cytochrome biogenesis protein CcmI [uncultured Brevundimonas sp.]
MTAVLTAVTGLLVLSGARRGLNRVQVATETQTDRLSGARELAELDRLKAAGQMDEASWTAARAEAARRILAARRADVELKTGSRDGFWVLVGVGVAAALALVIYVVIGTPGYGDRAYSDRVAEWAAQPDSLSPDQAAAVLSEVVAKTPEDVQALSMLGAARFEAGDALGAASAFRKALSILPDNAQNWARLGESLVRASDNRIGPDAEAAFAQALKLDDNQLGAHFFMGDAALGRGDVAQAERHWNRILAALDPADPRRAELQKSLAEARAKAAR